MNRLDTFISDMKRKQRYNKLKGNTKDRILMRYSMEQVKAFYKLYVNPETDQKKPVEDLNMLSMAGDLMKKDTSSRAYMVNAIEETVSLEEVINYSQKIKINIKDIVKEFEESKGVI